MSPLEQLHADQHDDTILPADAAFEAFLGEVSLPEARRDLTPTTDVERRHLARARRAA